MSQKCLMSASTQSHLVHFHAPYINALRAQGWEVHVAGAQKGNAHPQLVADRIIPVDFEKKFFSPKNFLASFQLRKLIKKEAYQLIICHTSLAAFFTRLAAIGVKKDTRIINVVHGYLFDESSPRFKSLILKSAEYLTASVTDLLLVMNQWDYSWARKHHVAGKLALIPGMGLDIKDKSIPHHIKRFGFDTDDFVLIYPAEFSKRKNQAMLITAMQRLPEHVKLVLPGTGDLLVECRCLAERLGVADRVLFPGYVQNVHCVLSEFEAAVTSSRSEGLPFNILEAMSAGVPVISSAVKGNTDLVRNGINGITYPYNDEEAFVSAVIKLMENESLRTEMGKAGQKLSSPYLLDNVLPEVLEKYLSVL